jgi:hypothetical protein
LFAVQHNERFLRLLTDDIAEHQKARDWKQIDLVLFCCFFLTNLSRYDSFAQNISWRVVFLPKFIIESGEVGFQHRQ